MGERSWRLHARWARPAAVSPPRSRCAEAQLRTTRKSMASFSCALPNESRPRTRTRWALATQRFLLIAVRHFEAAGFDLAGLHRLEQRFLHRLAVREGT